jgi:hypothetical protein
VDITSNTFYKCTATFWTHCISSVTIEYWQIVLVICREEKIYEAVNIQWLLCFQRAMCDFLSSICLCLKWSCCSNDSGYKSEAMAGLIYRGVEQLACVRALSLSFLLFEDGKVPLCRRCTITFCLYMYAYTNTHMYCVFLAQVFRWCGLRDKYRVCQNIFISVTRHLNMQSSPFKSTGWTD